MTTAAIARQAKISEPILYRHFPSKKALLGKLLEQVINEMTGTLRKLAAQEPDPVSALRKLCRSYPELSLQYRNEFQIINRVLIESDDAEVDRLLTDHYENYKGLLQEIIVKGQRNGLLRKDVPPAVGAWHLIHSALGFLLTRRLKTSLTAHPGHEMQLAETALTGLLPGENNG